MRRFGLMGMAAMATLAAFAVGPSQRFDAVPTPHVSIKQRRKRNAMSSGSSGLRSRGRRYPYSSDRQHKRYARQGADWRQFWSHDLGWQAMNKHVRLSLLHLMESHAADWSAVVAAAETAATAVHGMAGQLTKMRNAMLCFGNGELLGH